MDKSDEKEENIFSSSREEAPRHRIEEFFGESTNQLNGKEVQLHIAGRKVHCSRDRDDVAVRCWPDDDLLVKLFPFLLLYDLS